MKSTVSDLLHSVTSWLALQHCIHPSLRPVGQSESGTADYSSNLVERVQIPVTPDAGAGLSCMKWNLVTSKARGEALTADLNPELNTRKQLHCATGRLGSRLSYQQRLQTCVLCVTHSW